MAAFALYLFRIGGIESFDVLFRNASLQQELSGTEAFFVSHVPLRIEVDHKQNFGDFYKALRQNV